MCVGGDGVMWRARSVDQSVLGTGLPPPAWCGRGGHRAPCWEAKCFSLVELSPSQPFLPTSEPQRLTCASRMGYEISERAWGVRAPLGEAERRPRVSRLEGRSQHCELAPHIHCWSRDGGVLRHGSGWMFSGRSEGRLLALGESNWTCFVGRE